MKILFCGTYMPLELGRRLKCSSEAALKFQRNVLEELKTKNDVEILSYIPYMDDILSELESTTIYGLNIEYILKKNFGNYLKTLSNYFKSLNKMLDKKDVVILYNFNYINLATLYLARKHNVKSTLILADLDDADSEKSILKKLIIKMYERNIKKFDGVVFLSKGLAENTKTMNKIIIEGGIQLDKYEKITIPQINKDKMIVMYSGSLEIFSGIDLYLKSIERIENKNVEFIFTGKGYLEEGVKTASKNDNRIKYKGMVSEEEYYNLLQEANILINCKNMNLGENNNNFPSKVLEYIASGRTIISTKFSGYEKFEKNIVFTESNEVDLAKTIENALEDYENNYIDYYHNNKELSTTFSWTEQVMKIEKFIGEI